MSSTETRLSHKTRNPPSTRHVLITGANRGIGLEFVRQCLARGDRVFAGCRRPDELQKLPEQFEVGAALQGVPLDVSDPSSIQSAAEQISAVTDRLDLLIHNAGAGASGEKGLAGLDADRMLGAFRVNLLGPLLLTRACLELLSPGARVAILTSRTAILRPPPLLDRPGGQFSYPCSKAAMHRAIPILAADLRSRHITVVGVDPGWVRTGMTAGANLSTRYQLEPNVPVEGILRLLQSLDPSQSGLLFRWNGDTSRWYAPPETPEERQDRADSTPSTVQ